MALLPRNPLLECVNAPRKAAFNVSGNRFAFQFGMGQGAVQVQIMAAHSVTHEDIGVRATVDKGLLGAHVPTKSMESFNLDTVINGEHVFLACDDPKACESPAPGSYDGELKRNKWIKLKFTPPVSHKEVSRWYKIAGSW